MASTKSRGRIRRRRQELRQATLLEAQAAALQQQANQLAHEAKRVESDVIPALGCAMATASSPAGMRRERCAPGSRAYGYDPDTPGLMAHLAEAFKRLGDTRKEQVYALDRGADAAHDGG